MTTTMKKGGFHLEIHPPELDRVGRCDYRGVLNVTL